MANVFSESCCQGVFVQLVIGFLLDNDTDLTKKIYDIAVGVVVGVDSDDIEEDVYTELIGVFVY